uniref:F-box domain-containing protein n=1 Tax=Myripristis murdjan TaxID=586833 RepID=A0A667XF06_9TELE
AMETSEIISSQCWGSLPDVCLWHVFWWLKDRDRVNADLVCRRWHSVMRSPSLWRVRSFHFPVRPSKKRGTAYSSTMTYARYFGAYLHKLEVHVFPSPRSSAMAQHLQCTIKGLFDELIRANTRLRSLSLVGLELENRCWTCGLRSSLVNSLIHFIQKGASQLTTVKLKRMRNTLQQGLDLLSALSLAQKHLYPRDGISTLDLEEFFSGYLQVYLNHNMPRILHDIQGLTNLNLSYSCLSDALLMVLGHSCIRRRLKFKTLKTLSLRCCFNEPHEQVVLGTSWASIASRCPDLTVKIEVMHVINTYRLARILLPEIPLIEFHMNAVYSADQDWSAKPVLSEMLPQYRYSLCGTGCQGIRDSILALVSVYQCLYSGSLKLHHEKWANLNGSKDLFLLKFKQLSDVYQFTFAIRHTLT